MPVAETPRSFRQQRQAGREALSYREKVGAGVGVELVNHGVGHAGEREAPELKRRTSGEIH